MKYLTLLLLSAAAPVFAGSSSIYLNDDYQHVFATPSGNILCGGNSHKHAKADKRYTNDLYCFIGLNKAMPKRCEKQGEGLDFTLNAKGKAAMNCAGFEFVPYNEGYEKTRVLKYGETVSGNGWSCRSETSGLSCKNNDGHGFSINRQEYRLF